MICLLLIFGVDYRSVDAGYIGANLPVDRVDPRQQRRIQVAGPGVRDHGVLDDGRQAVLVDVGVEKARASEEADPAVAA